MLILPLVLPASGMPTKAAVPASLLSLEAQCNVLRRTNSRRVTIRFVLIGTVQKTARTSRG